MKIENVEVYGFVAAARGMRNPLESWAKNDSNIMMGPNDLQLACKLIKAGGSHCKFLRMITITADLTLARMIWTEFDTYKVATVRNSCSTMYKLGSRELTINDFEDLAVLPETLKKLNEFGMLYRADKLLMTLRDLKLMLPESYLMKSTVLLNYETALHMIEDRENHRMREWSGPSGIVAWLFSLPHMKEFYSAID